MKAEEFMRTTKVPLFPKDMMNKSFLYDGKEHVKHIKVDNKREDNDRYAIKVIFESQGRRLILTKRALFDLFSAVKDYPGTIVTVRFDGKQGDKKATKWLFSVVTEEKKQEKQEFSLIAAMKGVLKA